MRNAITMPIGATVAGAVLGGAMITGGPGQPASAVDEHAPMVDPSLIFNSAPADTATQAILSGDSDAFAAWVEQFVSTLPPPDPATEPPAVTLGVPNPPACPTPQDSRDTSQPQNIQQACNFQSPGSTTVSSATQGAPISQGAEPTDG